MKPNRWKALSIALAAVLVGVLVHTALAVEPLTPVTLGGGGVKEVETVRNDTDYSTNKTKYVDVPGAKVSVTVPPGETSLVLARFSAESVCYNGGTQWCTARIVVGAVAASPSGNDFAFDSTNGGKDGNSSWESHAMERIRGPLDPGTYEVKLQIKTSNDATNFRIDDWMLVAERIAAA